MIYFLLMGGLGTLMSAVTLSRIYLQVHYSSDVLGGILLAVLWTTGLFNMPEIPGVSVRFMRNKFLGAGEKGYRPFRKLMVCIRIIKDIAAVATGIRILIWAVVLISELSRLETAIRSSLI